MKIALIGYGKMGHAIEQVAVNRGHEVVLRMTSANKHEMDEAHLKQADVAIEFTRPESGRDNVLQCLSSGVSVVSGTTGWNDQLPEAYAAAHRSNVALLHASNFSVGVNIFFEVNKLLAKLMEGHAEYKISVEETHHIQKKDAPSGTAITITEQILQNNSSNTKWVLNNFNEKGAIPIVAHRVENVPGTHKVTYASAIDSIDIIHTAHSRDGFALGAVLAAEYIHDKKGVFHMKDVLGIK